MFGSNWPLALTGVINCPYWKGPLASAIGGNALFMAHVFGGGHQGIAGVKGRLSPKTLKKKKTYPAPSATSYEDDWRSECRA